MTNSPTTVRASVPPTIDDKLCAKSSSVTRVMEYWRRQTDANLLQAIDEFPSLLENKSLLIDLALKDYQKKRQHSHIPLDQYCQLFERFGSSIEQSIFRALEVQDYFEAHPELLQLVNNFDWPNESQLIQGFQVVEELGRGSLARAYLCHETGIGGREVVVKIARGGEYEASILGRLNHPNIVPIYSVTHDAEGAVSYICMPYRGRSTLLDLVVSLRTRRELPSSDLAIYDAARVREIPGKLDGPTPRNRPTWLTASNYVDGVLRLAIQLASALRHSHTMGVYHGDLKPSNVLLTPDGIPLLIDFNLATDPQSNSIPRGGTLAYMPPEQLAGICGRVAECEVKYDARSEIYSFGALIYQLLTGEVPYHFEGGKREPSDAARRLIEMQESNCISIGPKNSKVNASLEALIVRCLSRDPKVRPQTMKELEDQLHVECRTAAKVRRISASHPTLSRYLISATVTGIVATFGYLALRPPYQVRELAKATELRDEGQFDDALVHFDRALQNDPSDDSAAYERARTLLMSGQLAESRSEFARLWKSTSDPKAAAYVGLCFNRERNHSAAIPWYELAISHGLETAGVHNNLGVSYVRGRSTAGYLERFDRANNHFDKALELDRDSLVIRGNRIQTALVRSDLDRSFNLDSIVSELEYLCRQSPQSSVVSKYSVQLYSHLASKDKSYVDRALCAIDHAIELGANPPLDLLANSPSYAALRDDGRFAAIQDRASNSDVVRAIEPVISFLDPIAIR